ncbi:MAG TPA: TetR/AcrR family transcriptional regulator [Ktedonobacteraceae bacterium]|jgi:AcrR family transcriptional regulator|nr:TetR/AcrR family transcriptional regulator [Ktedonobacteraceae bacterium]
MMPNTDKLLTSRGYSSRERILVQAAQLIGEKGVQGTSLEDICVAASSSKGQLYHYFANKEDLVQAVIERQTTNVLDAQQPLLDHLDSWENLERWAALLIALQEERQCAGGCPIGSLASELADYDEPARIALANSFDQWERYLIEGFACMKERGDLRSDANPAELAVAVMSSLQGGLLLTQTRKTTYPLQIALHTALTYVRSFASQPEAS